MPGTYIVGDIQSMGILVIFHSLGVFIRSAWKCTWGDTLGCCPLLETAASVAEVGADTQAPRGV